MIVISAFNWVPDFAQGQVRDLRARWALEEAGIPYKVRLIDHNEKLTPAYRGWQPFCQVPAYEEGDVCLFESGAIVLHIAEMSEALMPRDPAGRARTQSWLLAALNSIEPFIFNFVMPDVFCKDQPWAAGARENALGMLKKRLDYLAQWLSGRTWLEDRFTAGDLMMACSLRSLDHTDLVSGDPVLGPYLNRCLDRRAFQRALAAQLADFTGKPSAA